MHTFFDPFVDFPFSLIDLRDQESQLTYLPVSIANGGFDLFLKFNKCATVPVSNFSCGVWALNVFNLRGRPFVRACGLVTTSIVGTVDKYNLPFIWQKRRENWPGTEDRNVLVRQASKGESSKIFRLVFRCNGNVIVCMFITFHKCKKEKNVILPQYKCAKECSHVTRWTVKVTWMNHIRHRTIQLAVLCYW